MADNKLDWSALADKLMQEARDYVGARYDTCTDEVKATLMLAYVQAFTTFANRKGSRT